ncbi:MAG TPA: four helix bundle protein [Candidatus Saccharimonadales bacterium]|nr:four helix bundle protein [Candidatus Saccharimonadales bacterium]
MSHEPTQQNVKKSIEGLRIYQTARKLEDAVHGLVSSLPEEQQYPLGNDLRRESAAIAHFISESHKALSYSRKLGSLHLARTSAESLQKQLAAYTEAGLGDTRELQEEALAVIKQSWGLIKYFKQRLDERRQEAQINASDELVAARV